MSIGSCTFKFSRKLLIFLYLLVLDVKNIEVRDFERLKFYAFFVNLKLGFIIGLILYISLCKCLEVFVSLKFMKC